MSNLPRQVQEAADEAARLETLLQPEGEAEPAPEESAPERAEALAPKAPAPAKVREPPKADDASWQQRYQTLQGMYNAEVPRMQQQIRDLSTQLQDTQARLNAPKETPKPAAPASRQGTEKDVETFGGDLIDLIKRQAADIVQVERDKMQADMGKLQTENAELKKQVGVVAQQQGEGVRYAYLQEVAKQVPDWEALNVDPGFLGWLAEVDPLSGLARQAYMNHAYEKFDVQRTANLFLTWKKANGKTLQQPTKQTAAQELARQVAPGTSKSSTPQVSGAASERIWTRQEIETFYTDVTKGLYNLGGKKDEAARIEAEIDAAVATGRIR